MRIALCTWLLAATWPGVADAACGPIGARYAPRSETAAKDISYRLTILQPTPQPNIAVERYRFELFSRRGGQRLSRIDLDLICGNGRAQCGTWQPNGEDPRFQSVVLKLKPDFSPDVSWDAAHAIVFAEFSSQDWITTLSLNDFPNVRYYSRPRVEPDLSGQTVWVRTSCGGARPPVRRSTG